MCTLDSGDAVLIHLRMSGQLLLPMPRRRDPPHTHIAMSLDGEELRFVDPAPSVRSWCSIPPARTSRSPSSAASV